MCKGREDTLNSGNNKKYIQCFEGDEPNKWLDVTERKLTQLKQLWE